MALSTEFHSINSPNTSLLSHSVLPILFLPYWSFQVYESLLQPWHNPLWLTGLKTPTNKLSVSLFVSWCFGPSQPQRNTTGLGREGGRNIETEVTTTARHDGAQKLRVKKKIWLMNDNWWRYEGLFQFEKSRLLDRATCHIYCLYYPGDNQALKLLHLCVVLVKQ